MCMKIYYFLLPNEKKMLQQQNYFRIYNENSVRNLHCARNFSLLSSRSAYSTGVGRPVSVPSRQNGREAISTPPRTLYCQLDLRVVQTIQQFKLR